MIKVSFFAVLALCNFCYGCLGTTSDTTPVMYKNNTKVSPSVYNLHQRILKDSIKRFIKDKSLAYYPKENDSLTEIIIDTVLYSPAQNKAAFFVITKNSNDKLLSAGNKNEYHYDAHCFTAYLNEGPSFNDIYWIRAFNISNFHTLKKASFRIREMYFKDFNQTLDVNDSSLYKYNLDDTRFWSGPIWKIMDDQKLKEREFENEKREHPENIYEPKKQ